MDDEAVRAAFTRSNSMDVPADLPDGLDSLLGRSFEAGRDLSGGQWQKLALGRGRMRTNPLVLVLDEPTASLDAIAEHAVLEHHVAAARIRGGRDLKRRARWCWSTQGTFEYQLAICSSGCSTLAREFAVGLQVGQRSGDSAVKALRIGEGELAEDAGDVPLDRFL